MNATVAVRPLHERRWRPGDHVPPHMPPVPPLTPDAIRADDAQRLWAAVLEMCWSDAHATTSSTGESLRTRAMQTANQRRAFVQFAANPLKPGDIAWMVSVLEDNPHALASAVHRKVRERWEPIRASDRWVRFLVGPEGEPTEVFHALPKALTNADHLDRWLLLGKPPMQSFDLPSLLRSRSCAEFDREVARQNEEPRM